MRLENLSPMAGAALIVGGLFLSSAAHAQDAAAEGQDTEAPQEDAKDTAEDAPENVQDQKKGKAQFPRISDDEETIYAVQRKAFLVKSKIELTPMGAFSFTDRFVQNGGLALSGTYHFAENFGVEVFGTYLFPGESGLTDEILREYKLTPEIAKLTQMQWGAGLGAQWSPIYGKLEIAGVSLGNFSFYVGAGLGVGQTRVQCTPATLLDPEVFGATATCDMIEATGSAEDAFKVVYEPSRTQVMGVLGGGVRFYFSNFIGLKLEVKDWIFPARVFRPGSNEPTQRYTDAIRNNVHVHVGVSFLFGGEDN